MAGLSERREDDEGVRDRRCVFISIFLLGSVSDPVSLVLVESLSWCVMCRFQRETNERVEIYDKRLKA